MKKMWNIRKDSSGVSPVIATILMVAITVVLAAVLYVMVSGFGGDGDATPTGSITKVQYDGTYTNVTFAAFDPTTEYTDCKYSLDGATAVSITENATDAIAGYHDLGGDGSVSTGDFLAISGSLDAGSHTIKILFTDGNQICEKSFTVAV